MSRKRRLRGVALPTAGGCVLLALFVAGCTTPRSTSPESTIPVSTHRISDERAAAKEVEMARRMTDAGDTSTVIPQLLHVMSKYPDTQAAVEARYVLGLAYYLIGDYRDAIDNFNDYLEKAPAGRYAADATACLTRATDDYNSKYISAEELDRQVADLTRQLQEKPGNPPLTAQLADVLWKRGDYAKAGSLYKTLLDKHPEYAKDEAIARRIELLPNGEYVVLTPMEVARRQANEQPLVIINQSTLRSGRDLFTREEHNYAVTGQVVNRGDSVLYGVQVIVTIYGVGNVVYDTTTATIGRLNPGEIRAFSVQLSNFENIENINRYECVGTFQR